MFPIEFKDNKRTLEMRSAKQGESFEGTSECSIKLLHNSKNFSNFGEWNRPHNPLEMLPEPKLHAMPQ